MGITKRLRTRNPIKKEDVRNALFHFGIKMLICGWRQPGTALSEICRFLGRQDSPQNRKNVKRWAEECFMEVVIPVSTPVPSPQFSAITDSITTDNTQNHTRMEDEAHMMVMEDEAQMEKTEKRQNYQLREQPMKKRKRSSFIYPEIKK